MAIGSAPEIGIVFKSFRDYSEQEKLAWWEYMRTEWSPNLMAGEAWLVYVDERLKDRFRVDVLVSVPNLWELGRDH